MAQLPRNKAKPPVLLGSFRVPGMERREIPTEDNEGLLLDASSLIHKEVILSRCSNAETDGDLDLCCCSVWPLPIYQSHRESSSLPFDGGPITLLQGQLSRTVGISSEVSIQTTKLIGNQLGSLLYI